MLSNRIYRTVKNCTSPLIISWILFCSCQQNKPEKNRLELASDTVIMSQPITDEIAGSAYRKRATGYFVVIDKAPSDYMPIFTESKEGGTVGLDLRARYSSKPRTYQELLNELKIILPKAARDYNLDSLKGISIGRLVNTGDLAIDITRQYYATFEQYDGIPTADYPRISDFLLKSRLGSDFNNVLNEYEIEVDRVNVEKVYFTSLESVRNSSKIVTDTTNLPEKILDCMTWINVKKTLK